MRNNNENGNTLFSSLLLYEVIVRRMTSPQKAGFNKLAVMTDRSFQFFILLKVFQNSDATLFFYHLQAYGNFLLLNTVIGTYL